MDRRVRPGFSLAAIAMPRRARKEFGIRSALGASPQRIRLAVLGDGGVVVVAGVLIGALGASSLGRVLASLQYGIAPGWVIVCSTLVLTTLVAWRPAHDAARADALRLLREE